MRTRRPIRAGIHATLFALILGAWLISYRVGYIFRLPSSNVLMLEGRGSLRLFHADDFLDDFGFGWSLTLSHLQRLDRYQISLSDRALSAEFPHNISFSRTDRWMLRIPFWPFACLFALLALRNVLGRRTANPRAFPVVTIPTPSPFPDASPANPSPH